MFCEDFKEVGIRETAGTQYVAYWAATHTGTAEVYAMIDTNEWKLQ